MRRVFALMLLCVLSGCGYHLVGQGDHHSGVITQDALLWVDADNHHGTALAQGVARALSQRNYSLAESSTQATQNLRIQHAREQLTPVAYDASGLAVQYRLTLTADARLFEGDNIQWQSDGLTEDGDIFANGGPTEVEAQRSRLLEQLQRRWVSQCVAELLSGF